MFKFNELREVHIEITNKCQAACPMCARNIHGGLSNPSLTSNSWTLNDFIEIFSVDILKQIYKINFCGTFGDPLMNYDLSRMCEHIKINAPKVEVQIHTNGSLKSTMWWKDLIHSLPTKHQVSFAIDGLEDTHAIYRINTNYNLILKNAKTFIDSGGNAEWAFIKFKHNEHQVNEAKTLANTIGFRSFTTKITRRTSKPFPVVDSKGKFLYNIEQPSDSVVKFVGRKEIINNQQWQNANKIDCLSIKHKELYIDAHYQLSPCCMIAAFLYTSYDIELLKKYDLYQEDSVIEEGAKIKQQILDFPRFNVLEHGLKNIIESEQWQTMWQQKWKDKTSSTCIIMCSADSPFMPMDDQIIGVEKNV